MAAAPLVALATTLVVSGLGIKGLEISAVALHSALNAAGSAHDLEAIAFGINDINAKLYHVLALRAAQSAKSDASAQLHPLMVESDQVIGKLGAWRAAQASEAQRPRIDALIAAVERYKGAVDFVSQMLDVDFVAAVSFMRPFDQNFGELQTSVDTLLREVKSRQRADAAAALENSANTTMVFEGVGSVAVLLAVLAASNMGWAAVRSQRLTRQNSMLTKMTQVDALTGLGNRRHFDEALAKAWADCANRRAPLTLVMFDIDNFKKFNDSQGHVAGDLCLTRVAEAVMACSRDEQDRAARYGGEEFAIILPDATLTAARAVAERVRAAVMACAIPHPAAGPPGIVTISLGVASLVPTAVGAPAELVEAADRGLYAAKRGGRNRVEEALAA